MMLATISRGPSESGITCRDVDGEDSYILKVRTASAR